jgi:hypothetical protein
VRDPAGRYVSLNTTMTGVVRRDVTGAPVRPPTIAIARVNTPSDDGSSLLVSLDQGAYLS